MAEQIQKILDDLLPDFKRTGLLDLRNCGLTDATIELIDARMTTDFSSVKRLLLSNNQLGEHGAKFIATLFAQLLSLEYVDLQSNRITDKGAIDLLTAANTANRHIELALRGNPIKRPADIAKIEQDLVGKRLQESPKALFL